MTNSYLDQTIDLVAAQIAVLTAAAAFTRPRRGPAIDVGLGNGRTYSHLCELMPDRDVFAFDQDLKAALASIPPVERLILGDVRETIPFALPRLSEPAILVHCDISTHDPTANLARQAWLSPLLAQLVANDAVVISRLPLCEPYFTPLSPEDLGVDTERQPSVERALGHLLFLYRAIR